jgi:hypothetical protein
MVVDDQVDMPQRLAEVVRLSTPMSSSFSIRWFSGRATGCNVPMMAVCLVRRSTVRRARPLAMASGSGSLCVRISTRSASLK